MKKVLIIGSNGAGKSTFSYRLAKKASLPLFHIDQIYWHGSWQVTPREEFEAALLSIAQAEKWIMEGNNIRSLGQRLQYADTVFWFEFPPPLCIWNILKREWKYRGKARPDMPETCISQLNLPFLKYAWNFNRANKPRIQALLKDFPNVKVIHFTNYQQLDTFLHNLP